MSPVPLIIAHVSLAILLLLPNLLAPFVLRRDSVTRGHSGLGRALLTAVIARPNLRRLLGLSGSLDQETWARLARRQRYLAYAMGALIGVIGVLMMTKPQLW